MVIINVANRPKKDRITPRPNRMRRNESFWPDRHETTVEDLSRPRSVCQGLRNNMSSMVYLLVNNYLCCSLNRAIKSSTPPLLPPNQSTASVGSVSARFIWGYTVRLTIYCKGITYRYSTNKFGNCIQRSLWIPSSCNISSCKQQEKAKAKEFHS